MMSRTQLRVVLPFVVGSLVILVFGNYTFRFVAPFTPEDDGVSHHRQSVSDPGVNSGGGTVNVDRHFTGPEPLQRRLPHCVIIGEMKCGTRALLEYIGLHPDIAMAVNETKFFTEYYNKGLEWYRDQMPLSKPGQLTVEKTPNYYRHTYTAERIRAMNDSIKLILVVRDPVDRSISEWIQNCRQLREANDKKAEQRCRTYESSGVLNVTGAVNPKIGFISKSMYATFIKDWTRWFALGTQLLVVDGDKLVSDPLSEIVRVENFLGLRNYLTKKNVVFDEEKGFHCMIFDDGHKRCLGESKGIPHPDLNPRVEAKLRKFFKPINQDFYRAVHHDFGWS